MYGDLYTFGINRQLAKSVWEVFRDLVVGVTAGATVLYIRGDYTLQLTILLVIAVVILGVSVSYFYNKKFHESGKD